MFFFCLRNISGNFNEKSNLKFLFLEKFLSVLNNSKNKNFFFADKYDDDYDDFG